MREQPKRNKLAKKSERRLEIERKIFQRSQSDITKEIKWWKVSLDTDQSQPATLKIAVKAPAPALALVLEKKENQNTKAVIFRKPTKVDTEIL